VIDVCRYPRDLRWLGLGPGVRIYPAGPGVEWIETLVTLVRQETGFGFRIVGGTEEGSQVRSMVRKELFSAVGSRWLMCHHWRWYNPVFFVLFGIPNVFV
jgi:hypothetical protein